MRKIFFLYPFLMMVLFLNGCSGGRQEDFRKWTEDNGKIKVLSTTAMINDLVKQIGQDRVDTLTLIQGELDPHSYQLVKGDDEKLGFATLIFYSGLGLEHGPSLQRYLSNNPKAVGLGDKILEQEPRLILEVDGQKDPHIWMDIELWSKTVPFIVEALSAQDPSHAQVFQENGQKLLAQMQEAHQRVKDIMHQVPQEQRYLVTSHDAFNYFARAYLSEEGEVQSGEWQKRFAAPEGLSPDSQLSTAHIRQIIDHMKKYRIEVLFPESNVSRDSLNKILQAGKEQGLNLKMACCPLYGDAMGEPGSEGDTYLKMIEYNAKMISQHMKL